MSVNIFTLGPQTESPSAPAKAAKPGPKTVQIFEEISALFTKKVTDKGAVLAKVEALPLELQWKLHAEVQKASKADHLGFEWGKRKLYEDPSQINHLKHPESQTESLLQYHLRTQRALIERVAHTKLYEVRGAHFQNGTTYFSLYAPQARKVALVLTNADKREHELPMQINPKDGIWKVETQHAAPGRTYLYHVEDCHGKKMLRTDPFSFGNINVWQADQIHSVVVDPSKFQWGDQAWMSARAKRDPAQAPLSIYELQLKSWKSGYNKPLNFKEMARQLGDYCKKMGFTHVECFGLLEHFYTQARGYQIFGYFAVYRDCGSYDDFKYFVDYLHRNGIGVILDWVPTHFQHYHQSSDFSVSFHELDGTDLCAAESAGGWGTRFLDYSKPETYRLLFASALYFLDKLHIDGLRFDAVSQMVRRNKKDIPAGISFLKELNDTIHACYPGVMTIAEETDGFPNVVKSTQSGGLGFDMQWDIGWSYDARDLMRTPYPQRAQHWHQKVLQYLYSIQKGEKRILTHSHDDTDDGAMSNKKVLLQCVAHVQESGEKFANIRNFFAWQRLLPSYGHMLHMGDELAQPESWYQRLQQDKTSVDWALAATAVPSGHTGVQVCVQDLNALYLGNPQFWETRECVLISEYAPNAVIAYHRGTTKNKRIAVIHNFSNTGYPSYDVPLPSSAADAAIKRIAKVQQIFSSDHLKYGGSGKFDNLKVEILRDGKSKEPTHFRLALPPVATLVLEEELT